MATTITLPRADGSLERYTLRGPGAFTPAAPGTKLNRIAFSAAHVVADARAASDPWLDCSIDWDTTIAYRRRLWSMGLGVAEAMDTAQRGMGLDWPTSLELIRRSLDAARDVPGARIASRCGTEHLPPDTAPSVDDVIRAYEQQMPAIEAIGGKLIVMASRALARVATSPGDYERVYDRMLRQAKQPVMEMALVPFGDIATLEQPDDHHGGGVVDRNRQDEDRRQQRHEPVALRQREVVQVIHNLRTAGHQARERDGATGRIQPETGVQHRAAVLSRLTVEPDDEELTGRDAGAGGKGP